VTHSNERNQTTSSFAASTGALVAINGDWFEYGSYQPNGLAIADGEVWSQDRAEWLFLACDVANNCLIDGVNTLATIDPAWKSAIGGNGAALVVNGQAQLSNEAFYATDRHPRSAVGLTGDGRMFLVVAEGRQGDAAGMTFNEMAQLLVDLGAVRGMMLDGGGSSTLVIDGQRVNDLPSGSGERSVGDHFAIVPAR
jgi:exopolysaccharide biosynthesis protein